MHLGRRASRVSQSPYLILDFFRHRKIVYDIHRLISKLEYNDEEVFASQNWEEHL